MLLREYYITKIFNKTILCFNKFLHRTLEHSL
nr:MAG TPA: hypothetical protein [Caudoviricetes sp.]